MKEWIDKLVDDRLKLNETMREHGAGISENYILIYKLHTEIIQGIVKYGLYDMAKMLNVDVKEEFVKLDDKYEKKIWFMYRDVFFVAWEGDKNG